LVLLEDLKHFVSDSRFEPYVVLRRSGPVAAEFAALAPTIDLQAFTDSPEGPSAVLRELARFFKSCGAADVICNTVVCADAVGAFAAEGLRPISYLHELPTSIEMYTGKQAIETIATSAAKIIVVSEFVADALCTAYRLDRRRMVMLHNGFASRYKDVERNRADRESLRSEFGWGPKDSIVLATGAMHQRKGPDLFVQMARLAVRAKGGSRLRFLWVGEDQDGPTVRHWCAHDLKVMGLEGVVRFAGGRTDMPRFYAGADVFVLTSREDPMPLVVLEALAAGLPVVAFEGCSGAPEILPPELGQVVPYLDIATMAKSVIDFASEGWRKFLQSRHRAIAALRRDHCWENRFARLVAELDSSAAPALQRGRA
jgi:glycosyltransferase involved in cell wall biosynthesis